MERSRKLALTNWTLANDALVLRFAGNKSELTKAVKMSRTTVTAFFKGESIREAEFRKICTALLLNWQEISSVPTDDVAKKDDSLEQIRSHCRGKILQHYSKIRLLSGQEIGVDQLYVDVWLLNRQPRTFQVSESKMLESFDLRNDRLGLGDRIKRNDGFDVANQEAKLLILGKPGAGKTTFLKHLAVDWSNGKFQSNLIAVFIEFRQIRNDKWLLLDAIGAELEIQDKEQVKALLKDGKLLVLMDGFDEVPTQALRSEVQHQLGQLAKSYSNNRYIMTCRTQTMHSIPDGFMSVEVADFNIDQVQAFVCNWFQANGQNGGTVKAQWQNFELAIDSNLALKELTVTPVLLGLMCLVLQDEGEIPAQAGLLYERGIRLLLRKWNDDKAIDGWEVGTEAYQKLNIEQKEKLLIEIAARKFENPENFVLFDQGDLVEQIFQYLKLEHRVDAQAVLRSIESQHGLLIERADELWSFSHLTFQEYFTTKWLLSLPAKELSQKISGKRWQEVVKQLVIAQGESDRLLRLIKKATDYSISSYDQLQDFLVWIDSTSLEYNFSSSRTVIRTVFFARALDNLRNEVVARNLMEEYRKARYMDLKDLIFAFNCLIDLVFFLAISVSPKLDLIFPLASDIRSSSQLSYPYHKYNNNDFDIFSIPELYDTLKQARRLHYTRDLDKQTVSNLGKARDRVLKLALLLNKDFVTEINRLQVEFLQSSKSNEFEQWLNKRSEDWVQELQQAIMEYRHVDYDCKILYPHQEVLQRYHNANKLLIELLRIKKTASPEVRQEIEDNLLLPMAELKRRLPDQYGD